MSGNDSEISREVQVFLLQLARNVIDSRLREEVPLIPDQAGQYSILKEKRGVFVTLKKDGQLRGCIGYPLPYKTLLDAIVDNAQAAAFQDPRFPPVRSAELPGIHLEISILTVPKRVVSADDVLVGRDGIIISTAFNRGLLLPQVPVEQNWDLHQYLDYGCLKAGLPLGFWRNNPVSIDTFQAQVFSEGELAGT